MEGSFSSPEQVAGYALKLCSDIKAAWAVRTTTVARVPSWVRWILPA